MAKLKYIEINAGMTFTHNGIQNLNVSFIPGETINCFPAYEKGKKDSKWIKKRNGETINCFNKTECENKIGMQLQAITEAK